jgi:PAS domain S-box-containing protein
MQRALSGQSGTVVGLDYRGERVLAAYEPVAELNLGIVAKIDLAEILAPFVRAALIAALSAIVLIAIGAVLFFRVTNPLLKSLEGSEKRFRAIFEQAPMGVALGDAAGHTLDANPALQQLLLYNRKDLLALGVTGTSHPDDLELDQELFNELVKGERDSYQIEKRFTRRDGQTVWGNLTVSIVHEAGTDPPLILGLLEDITERKRAEEALEAYSNRLEELVEERTQALTEAQERLVRQERLAVLGQLAGGVGHELRNPLGVISNAVYYLQATLSNADRTTQEYLIIISDQVKRAISIISDLLALAHTRTSEPELIQARDLLGSVLDHRPPPGEVHVVNQLPPHLPPLWVDSEQLREVLDRLVTNAYQAMPNGGDLRIDASVESGVVRISLSDTGTGIPQEHMDELFKPLFTTRARGIGLGLAISKNLVEINGGSIEVDSTEGVGSTFTLVLPGGEAAME